MQKTKPAGALEVLQKEFGQEVEDSARMPGRYPRSWSRRFRRPSNKPADGSPGGEQQSSVSGRRGWLAPPYFEGIEFKGSPPGAFEAVATTWAPRVAHQADGGAEGDE